MNLNVPTLRLGLAAVLTVSTGAVAAAQPAPAPPPVAPGAALAPTPASPPVASGVSGTLAPSPASPGAPAVPAAAPAPGAPAPAASPSSQDVPVLPPPPVFEPTAAPAPTPPPPVVVAPAMKRAPRVYAISAGWSYMPSNALPLTRTGEPALTPQGLNVEARLGWQVGGYQSGWNSYVGFRSCFFYYAGGTGVSESLGLDYGIFIKHVLFPGGRVRLFVGYGLGAVQVWVMEVGGRGVGHSTRLAAGLDTRLTENVHVSFEFAYKFNILPSFASDMSPGSEPPSFDFHTISLLGGLWFGK